jgi:hypothetical protein
VFTVRMVEHLQVIADPGPGDVDRALRVAWVGLWVENNSSPGQQTSLIAIVALYTKLKVAPPVPPLDTELRAVSRWDRDEPQFERGSKRAW